MTTDTTQQERRAKLQALANEFHSAKYGDYDDSYEQFAAIYRLTWDDDEVDSNEVGVEVMEIPRYVSMMHDETYNMLDAHKTLKDALNRMAYCAGADTLGNAGPLWDLDICDVPDDNSLWHVKGMIGFTTVMLTDEMAKLMKYLIDDAIMYRRSDDEDEDGDNDNKQADKYAEIGQLFE